MRVWIDIWIPSIPYGWPSLMNAIQVNHNTRVDSLICPVNGEWDIKFLKPFVSDEEHEMILET